MQERATNTQYVSLWDLGLGSIRELEVERGILASGRTEVYGCVFGRDSLITALTLMRVYARTQDAYFLALTRKILVSLASLQGREVNIESGEEPGKCIHEYRPDNHERLTGRAERPWYVYADNEMRNYDTVDATPLFLMAAREYVRVSGDASFAEALMPNIRAALDWMRDYGDGNGDGLIDYRMHPERVHGGLVTQSWMDSAESVFFEERDIPPRYPVAPVEAQAYAYAALRGWSDYFGTIDGAYALELSSRAAALKAAFNEAFALRGRRGATLAYAVDGDGKPLTSARSSMGHCLWASWKKGPGEMPDIIIADEHIPSVARRLMAPDLYLPRAGIRTLSSRSSRYDPKSYHNGSIWPHDTAIVAEGLENVGFREEAKRVRRALLHAYAHFKTPLELFVYTRGRHREYEGSDGQRGCRVQAWSAAALLTLGENDA